ncbi:hypothetical protein Tco_0120731 [Tanacetum coccineum]
MDNSNITMEEYIRLEEEKVRRCGKVYNWETSKYGKIWYDEDVHDLRSVETEFPAIVFNDELSSEKTLSCEPTVSSLDNNEFDFKITFDESDDEDNTPKVSCFDDLDFFKDFENEFPAIVYNDALTSKSDFLTESTLSPQHINEFDLKDETSLSDYDEVEQNILYFNNLFPFNIIYPDNLKMDKDNDDNEIDSHWGVEGYTKEIVHDFEQRLEMIFGRQVNRVHVLDFKGLTPEMRHDLTERLRMVYTEDDGQEIFFSHAWRSLGGARRSMSWRQFILALGLYTSEEMAEDGFDAYLLGSERVIPDKGDLSDYSIKISSEKDFLRAAPSYTYIKRMLVESCMDWGTDKVAAAAALGDAEDAPDVDEGAQAIPAPVHAPPPPPLAVGRTMHQRLGRLEEEIQGLCQDIGSLHGLVERSMTDQGRFSTWMISCMTQLVEASGRTYQVFDGTFRGSYPEVFERRTR